MSLRPRYSLLTLLVFMALVAGGVKLWYGPHHVVERTTNSEEQEYTFIRTWEGKRILLGPRVIRTVIDGSIQRSLIGYYRKGKLLEWSICNLSPSNIKGFPLTPLRFSQVLAFTTDEEQEHSRTIQQEAQKYVNQGTPVSYVYWASNWHYKDL